MLLDLSALADRHGYAGVGAFAPSPDGELVAYTLDTTGAEQWRLHIDVAATRAPVDRIDDVLNMVLFFAYPL